jgi:hypothetical protein
MNTLETIDAKQLACQISMQVNRFHLLERNNESFLAVVRRRYFGMPSALVARRNEKRIKHVSFCLAGSK